MSNANQNQNENQNRAEEEMVRRANEVNKLFRISGFLQLIFIVIAILAMAFAQAIGAQLGLAEVLKVLGACLAIEIIVVWAIGTYIHLAQGTLDDVSHNVLDMSAKAATTVKSIAETAAAEGKNVIAAAKDAAGGAKDAENDTDDADKGAEEIANVSDAGEEAKAETEADNATSDDDSAAKAEPEKKTTGRATRKRSTRTK